MTKHVKNKVKSARDGLNTTKNYSFKKKIKRKEIIIFMKKELSKSSTHGLPYIVKENLPLVERVFWLVSFVGAFIVVFLLLSPLYQRFILSPTVMSVEKDYFNWNVSYPAFTLCPKNKIDDDAFSEITTNYSLSTGLNLSSLIWLICNIDLDNLDIVDLQYVKNLKAIQPEDYAYIAASTFRVFTNVSLTTNTNLPIAVESAMTEMGMCHVINSNVAAFDDPLKWREGKELVYEKKNIELSVYDGDFFSQITNYEKSYTAYVHSPDEIRHSATAAYIHDSTGFLSIGVNVWSTRIASHLRSASLAVRKCRLTHEPMSERYPIYTYSHCMLECRIKTILRLCGCIPHFYRPLESERICNLSELKCLVHYKREILTLSSNPVTLSKTDAKPSQQCGCLSNCETDVYLKDYDSAMRHTSPNRLRVGLASFPKVRIVREIIFGLDDIFLRSGGVINLCIGSSIISMMEHILIDIKCIYRIIMLYMWKRN